MGIKLGIKDISHLYKIKELLHSSHKIRVNSGNSFGKDIEYCELSICNQKIVDDLINLGCNYNKTHILKFPTEDILPKEYVRHFIRGFMDGDGSVFYNKSSINVSFIGTLDMMNGLLFHIKQVIPTKASVYEDKRHKDIFYISIGGNQMLYPLYEYLYKDATIYLDRKKQKFDTYYKKDAQRL